MAENCVLYAAVYCDADTARADLEAFDDLNRVGRIGTYDAAVIEVKDARPHIVKRADHPAIRVIPEWLGAGTLRRRELHEAAQALEEGRAALIVVGETTIEQWLERTVTSAAKTVKKELDTATDELAKELVAALEAQSQSPASAVGA
jgi:hypothetical protein